MAIYKDMSDFNDDYQYGFDPLEVSSKQGISSKRSSLENSPPAQKSILTTDELLIQSLDQLARLTPEESRLIPWKDLRAHYKKLYPFNLNGGVIASQLESFAKSKAIPFSLSISFDSYEFGLIHSSIKSRAYELGQNDVLLFWSEVLEDWDLKGDPLILSMQAQVNFLRTQENEEDKVPNMKSTMPKLTYDILPDGGPSWQSRPLLKEAVDDFMGYVDEKTLTKGDAKENVNDYNKESDLSNKDSIVTSAPSFSPLDENQILLLTQQLSSEDQSIVEKGLRGVLEASVNRQIEDQYWVSLKGALMTHVQGTGLREKLLYPIELQKKWVEKFGEAPEAVVGFEHVDLHGNTKTLYGSVFSRACDQGHLEEVNFWGSVFGPRWNPHEGAEPIEWAVHHPEVLAELLRLGASANLPLKAPNGEVRLPLLWAISEKEKKSAELLLRSGARWGTLLQHTNGPSRAMDLVKLLDPKFLSSYATEMAGLLAHAVMDKDKKMIQERALDFHAMAIAGALDVDGFDWALASKKMEDALKSLGDHRENVMGILREAFEVDREYISFANVRREKQKGNALSRSAAFGLIDQASFWIQVMGANWININEQPPLEIAISNHQESMIKALMAKGASVSGLYVNELKVLVDMMGTEVLDPIVNVLKEKLQKASKDQLANGILDLHNLAAFNLVDDKLWVEFAQILKNTIHSKENFGYHVEATKLLRDLSADKRTIELGDKDKTEVELFDFYNQACRQGERVKAKFFATAMGSYPDKSALDFPLLAALSGEKFDVADMLIKEFGANINEGQLLNTLAQQRSSKGVIYLLEKGVLTNTLTTKEVESFKNSLKDEELESLKSRLKDKLQKAPSEEALEALATIERSVLFGFFTEKDFAEFNEKVTKAQSVTSTDSIEWGDFKRKSNGLSELKSGEDTLLQQAFSAGTEQEFIFWSSIKGLGWVNNSSSSLMQRAMELDEPKMLSVLIQMGADLYSEPRRGMKTYLHQAIADRRGDLALTLLKAGINVWEKDPLLAPEVYALMQSNADYKNEIKSLVAQGDLPAVDALVEPGSLSLAMAEKLIETGNVDRFWRLVDGFDWNSSADSLLETAQKNKASGIQAYVELKAALANDDLQAARDLVLNNLNLLPALAKRGLAEKTLISSIEIGAAPLLDAYEQMSWPISSAIFKNASQTLLACADTGDMNLLRKIGEICPDPLLLPVSVQQEVARKAIHSGGERFLKLFEEKMGGFDVAVTDSLMSEWGLQDSARYPVLTSLIQMNMDRQIQKIEAKKEDDQSKEQWSLIAKNVCIGWEFLPESLKEKVLSAAVELPSKTFWNQSAFEIQSRQADIAAFLSQRPGVLSQVMMSASAENLDGLAEMAQQFAAENNNSSIALIGLKHGLLAPSRSALIKAMSTGASQALQVFVQNSPIELKDSFLLQSTHLLAQKEQVIDLPSLSLITDMGVSLSESSPGDPQLNKESLRVLNGLKELATETKEALLAVSAAAVEQSQKEPLTVEFVNSKFKELRSRKAKGLYNGAEGKEDMLFHNVMAASVMEVIREFNPENSMLVNVGLTILPELLPFASETVLAKKEMITGALEQDGLLLKYLNPELRADVDVCLIACANNPKAVGFIHQALISALHIDVANSTEEQVQKALMDTRATSKSYNPLTLMSRLTVQKALNFAKEKASYEVIEKKRTQDIDFSLAYKNMGLADLPRKEESALRAALSMTITITQDKMAAIDEHEKNKLRRLWQKDMPTMLEKLAGIPVDKRNVRDSDGETPLEIIRKAIDDSVKTLDGIKQQAIKTALLGMKVESEVIADKAINLNRFRDMVEEVSERADSPEAPAPAVEPRKLSF